MLKPLVSILVPNYKTAELTKLCLRLLRKHTDPRLAKVLVIDNDSQDDSLSYLKSLSWIHLIERPRILNEAPVVAHAQALDLGLAEVDTPYVLSIHTDTMVKNPRWLNFLISHLEQRPAAAGVGSWKLEAKPWHKRLFKHCERYLQTHYRRLVNKQKPREEQDHYLRSHCALYRTALLKQHQLRFTHEEQAAGKLMHKQLIDLGHEMIFLPSETLGQYLDHINHATTLLNPEFKATIRRNRDKALRRMEQRLHSLGSREVLREEGWDL